ncbi:MAG: hypothetical protein ACLRSW_15210 [Christensenellaceae bacterium]
MQGMIAKVKHLVKVENI